MEYLVKISKKARILDLKRRHLKITVLTSNTPYPSRKIRRICACTSQKTTKETRSIRRIQRRPICRIQDIECEYSGRYQTWSLLQETPDTPLDLSRLLRSLNLYPGIFMPPCDLVSLPSCSSNLVDNALFEEVLVHQRLRKTLIVQFRRTSLTGFPAQSIRSSNAIALDSPYLLVLITGTSQSRHHGKSESDRRIFIVTVNTKEYHSDVLAIITRIMRRTY
ncbi:hypothetical protein Tco_0152265 [Tanacetum coccineum]